MSQAAIAAEVHEALDRKADVAAKVAFGFESGFHALTNFRDLCVGEIIGTQAVWQLSVLDDLFGARLADAVDVLQSDDDSFVSRKVDTTDTCHICLPLPLLVLRVLANHADHAFTLDDLA